MVEWQETVPHVGRFRVAFDDEGKDFPNPMQRKDTNTTLPIFLDGLFEKTSGGGNATHRQMITFPNKPCANCTLQVIQVMKVNPPYNTGANGDVYYQCADIVLEGEAMGGPADGGVGSPADAGAGGSSGGSGGSSGGGGASGGSGGASTGAGGSGGSSGSAGGSSGSVGGGSGGSSGSAGSSGTGGSSPGGSAGSQGSGSGATTGTNRGGSSGSTTPTSSTPDGASGCSVGGGGSDAGGWAMIGLLLALGLRRRSRR